MKRFLFIGFVLVFVLTACGTVRESGAYTIYCRADLDAVRGADAVCPLNVDAEGENDTQIALSLLQQMIDADGETYTSPIPHGTRILSVTITDMTATVDLSGSYTALSGTDLTIADACIVLTLCALPSVNRVQIIAEGRPLSHRKETILSERNILMSSTGDEIRTLHADLYFRDSKTGELSAEHRVLSLYEGQSACSALLDALLAGPETDLLISPLPSDAEIISARVDEGVCCLDLSDSFLHTIPEGIREQEAVIYSMVRSLCSLRDIQAVQISFEGETVRYYGGIDISAPLS